MRLLCTIHFLLYNVQICAYLLYTIHFSLYSVQNPTGTIFLQKNSFSVKINMLTQKYLSRNDKLLQI